MYHFNCCFNVVPISEYAKEKNSCFKKSFKMIQISTSPPPQLCIHSSAADQSSCLNSVVGSIGVKSETGSNHSILCQYTKISWTKQPTGTLHGQSIVHYVQIFHTLGPKSQYKYVLQTLLQKRHMITHNNKLIKIIYCNFSHNRINIKNLTFHYTRKM